MHQRHHVKRSTPKTSFLYRHQQQQQQQQQQPDDNGSPTAAAQLELLLPLRHHHHHPTKSSIHFRRRQRRGAAQRRRQGGGDCCCCCRCGWIGGTATTLLLCCYLVWMMGFGVPTNKRYAHYDNDAVSNISNHNNNNHTTVSVVVMNYARPRMLQQSRLLPELLRHTAVDEILLCHANAPTAFHWDHPPKVQNINAVAANDRYGLALRFHYCRQARNDWVIHVDDDMELDGTAITTLVDAMTADPHRIVGHYGRRYNFFKVPHRLGYDYATTLAGPVEVVLTKLLILERQVCDEFFRHADLVEDVVRQSQPKWNGEDIFVNLVANHLYQVPGQGPFKNYAIPDLHVWEAPNELKDDDAGLSDISHNLDRHYYYSSKNNSLLRWLWELGTAWWRALQHYRYRGRLWATAKARLAALHDDDDDDASAK